jgi:hypothetical protein
LRSYEPTESIGSFLSAALFGGARLDERTKRRETEAIGDEQGQKDRGV